LPRMKRAKTLLGLVAPTAGLALGVACGDRTALLVLGAAPPDGSDSPFADAGAEACSTPPSCGNNTRGTWRLETADHEPAGYLFTFDGRPHCGETADAFELDLAPADGGCSLNGEYVPEEDTESVLRFTADNLGGNFEAACGDNPNAEGITLSLTRLVCDPATYELTVHDSAPGSPFDFTAVATRCLCDINWVACVQPLASDPCMP